MSDVEPEPAYDPMEFMDMPIAARVAMALRKRITELEPPYLQRCADEDPSEAADLEVTGYVGFRDGARFPVKIGEIDSVEISGLLGQVPTESFRFPEDDGLQKIVFYPFRDGKPYRFDSDWKLPSSDYTVFILPEYRPFIATLHAFEANGKSETQEIREYLWAAEAGKATPPFFLDEDSCQQLLGILNNPLLRELAGS